MVRIGEKLIEPIRPKTSSRNSSIQTIENERVVNLNFSLRMGRSTMRERKVECDKPIQHPVPEVNEYHQHVLAIANDSELFRKLQQDMRNSQHSILGSQHAIHIIIQKCAKEATHQVAKTKLENLRAPLGGEQEKRTTEGGRKVDGRQFFADLKAKSPSDQQLTLIAGFRNSFRRGCSFRMKRQTSPPCA
jgi:hypothetical protein